MKIFEMMQHNIHDMDDQLFEELFSKTLHRHASRKNGMQEEDT